MSRSTDYCRSRNMKSSNYWESSTPGGFCLFRNEFLGNHAWYCWDRRTTDATKYGCCHCATFVTNFYGVVRFFFIKLWLDIMKSESRTQKRSKRRIPDEAAKVGASCDNYFATVTSTPIILPLASASSITAVQPFLSQQLLLIHHKVPVDPSQSSC